MKQNKYYLTNLGVLLASFASLFVLATAPVYASHGTDDSTETATTSGGTGTSTGTETNDVGDDNGTDQTSGPGEVANANPADWKQLAQQNLSNRRHGKPSTRTTAVLDQICQNHQTAITNRLSAYNNNAGKFLTRLDDVFTKLQTYATTNKIDVAEQVASAKVKQTDATNAVTALKGLTVTCTTTDPAASFLTVKEGAMSTRDALKAYQSSLKDLVVSLMQSKSTDTTSQTGGNQ